MHPFCRSTTIADFGEDTLKGLERRAKDENGNTIRVPANMTYDEWYAKYVDGIGQAENALPNAQNSAVLHLTTGGDSGIIKSENDLSSYIGVPITQSDNKSVREWYYANVHDIPNQIDRTLPFIDQVHQAFDLRNRYKHEARVAMSDRDTADRLEKKRPPPTFEALLADKMQRKNMTEEQALNDILETASKTNPAVDEFFDLGGA